MNERARRSWIQGLGVLLPLLMNAAFVPTPAVDPPLSSPFETESDPEPIPVWEVTHEGATVYLLGSIHLVRPEVFPLDERIYEAFDAASAVAFELDFEELATSNPVMVQRGTFTDGKTLRGVLSEDEYDRVARVAGGLGVPIQQVDQMKPWLAGLVLSGLELQRSGFQGSIDLHLYERAREMGKPILALETVEDQVNAFDDLSLRAQVASLLLALEQAAGSGAVLDEATALWQAGDVPAMAALLVDDWREESELMERLLYERNRNWVSEIEDLLFAGESVMVVVGIAHLVGAGSVVDLLQQRGFHVAQVGARRSGSPEAR